MSNFPATPPKSELLIYQTEDGRTRNAHIQNIFEESELSPESVIRKCRITTADGKTYETNHYNLDVIISAGYRIFKCKGSANV